jgi:hypothetical protein
MNDLIKLVTPLTRAIIWFVKDEADISNPHYKKIDYLLDGLLTANLKVSQNVTSRVIIGQNFNKSLYVMILKEPKVSEIDSFISLFKDELQPENVILVIDEAEGLSKVKNTLKPITSQLRIIQ